MICQDGEDGFACYLAHRMALVNYVAPMIGSRDDAEEIVQEVYLRFSRRHDQITGSVRAYLFSIAHNLALDLKRRRKRESGLNAQELPDWASPQGDSTPEHSMVASDELRRISDYLKTCPKEYGLVLEMYRFRGLTMEQIAAQLEISAASVHRILRKTLAALAALSDPDA